MYQVYTFQVFVGEHGQYGTPHSLIVDESREYDTVQRIAIASSIGHDETVFVNDLPKADVSMYHSLSEIDFAGSALVGAAWQLSQLNGEVPSTIRCRAGEVVTWRDGDIYWVKADTSGNLGNWEYEHLESPEAVEAIQVDETEGWKKMVWAWLDEEKGLIRARTFASTINIPEVQANGSGSMNLAGQIGRSIQILHGDGSVIYARPADNNFAELGGRVRGL